MLDRTATQNPERSPAAIAFPGRLGQRRRRALAVCAALALGLHAAFLDGVTGFSPGGAAEPAAQPLSVRTILEESQPEPVRADLAPAPSDVTLEAAPTPRPLPRARAPARAARATALVMSRKTEASASSPISRETVSSVAASPALAERTESTTTPEPVTSEVPGSAEANSAASAPALGAPPAALPGAGDALPPLYLTRLPRSATLHYEVRRGFLRGDGEIRWQANDDSYRLVLAARVAGLMLLQQTSEGGIDANGLAPVRFLDQRARRSAQAANFVRDAGRITFSGTGVEWPLLPGSQDRLSWMIQLAGIAAAQPELLSEGGRVVMAVVGARGDASVWTLRCVGWEEIETARGSVHAVKLVREARSAYDTSAEIWLDPERWYLPVHATLRNSSGASEYDLLLERVEPMP